MNNHPERQTARFEDFALPEPLLQAIGDLRFTRCTPIQAEVLPHTLQGRDAVGRAQTGTGKTAAFLVTIITAILAHPIAGRRRTGTPRAVAIAPVRELAQQITRDAEDLGQHTNIRTLTLIGGEPYEHQFQNMQERPVDLLVATPGRLLDFYRRRHVNFQRVEFLVIDEADRMLDMGFIRDVSTIIGAMPPKEKRQTMLFSATIDARVRRLANAWLEQPVTVEVAPEQVAAKDVKQVVYLVSMEQKYRVLHNILQEPEATSVLIFVNRRDRAQRLYDRLKKENIKCGLLSGAVAQERRERTLERFRGGKLQAVVATDVAGRGLHIEGISHVVNYDLPEYPEDYVHRIGRTGRAGQQGHSISMACEDGAFFLPAIEALLGEKLSCIVPSDKMLA